MQNPLPKIELLPGTVQAQEVRCGKPNCRCASGKPHKAYYRFWREKGKLRKVYVRRADVERVRGACEAWAECERATKAMVNGPAGDAIRKEMRDMLRSAGATESMINRYRNRG